MSFKDFVELIEKKSHWIFPLISACTAWLVSRNRNKADIRKALLDADETSIDVRIKEDAYENAKYVKLFNRVVESDKIIEKLSAQIQDVSQKLLNAMRENAEIRAELSLYKTIS